MPTLRDEDRCTGPSCGREDGRCHNRAFVLGLCIVHLRMQGKITTCPTCLGSGKVFAKEDQAVVATGRINDQLKALQNAFADLEFKQHTKAGLSELAMAVGPLVSEVFFLRVALAVSHLKHMDQLPADMRMSHPLLDPTRELGGPV